MTPAEKRIKDLIDRWLTSLDLHLQYVDLNDSAYNRVQPWPIHDRPSRWVLELAKQKTLELKTAFEARLGMGDAKFADALELMMFLANMIGSQHVQRSIPLADPERHGKSMDAASDIHKPIAQNPAPPATQATKPAPSSQSPSTAATASSLAPTVSITAIERTVEMPRPAQRAPQREIEKTKSPAPTANAHPLGVDNEPTREMPRPPRVASTAPSTQNKVAAKAERPPPPKTSTIKGGVPESHRLVISDAVRLINWGRNWHELAESIARMADRPKLQEVRKILRSHRTDIETRAAAEAPEPPPQKAPKRK